MSENDFEDVDCVTFDNDPRTWILKEKIHENKSQLDKMEFDGTHVASKSWEVYICENSADPSEEAIIKIYKQIPYIGSEFTRPQVRRRQALPIDGLAKKELDALRTFTEKGCASTPKLLGYKEEVQGPQDIVPGGFILYLLMERLPGSCLDEYAFWDLDESERAKVLEKFKTAWIDCYNAGLVPSNGLGETIMWDPAAERVYFTGFSDSFSSEESPEGWSERQWDEWDLFQRPRQRQKPVPTGAETGESLLASRSRASNSMVAHIFDMYTGASSPRFS
ncbi:hypothetical protein DTO169E5_568 [Paecilomyces variotii]|nr:hypothetical protein DTO169C6_2837 [Paecilomyces variotii]KAJ9245849.1 hypothetical protein DTO169E5_568 [Paecilomyces variotii]KAJ9286560.1 hypothetical protein DTO021C3_5908 [Paecilomyces variotii]KAJ9401842.1 hypothetical protein DTO282F9_1132 [Paecilomyces variotii]